MEYLYSFLRAVISLMMLANSISTTPELHQNIEIYESYQEEISSIATEPTIKENTINIEKPSVIEEIASRPGIVGRFYIPDLDIDVAIFNSVSQSVADAKDSANYFAFGDMMVLGDHWNQGNFNNIKKCVEGTKAYIDNGKEIQEYICVKSFTGHNKVNVMTDDTGNSLNYGYNTGGLTLYTCNGCWQDIWICFFRPVGK